jgi:hypothetical protein
MKLVITAIKCLKKNYEIIKKLPVTSPASNKIPVEGGERVSVAEVRGASAL